MSEQDLIEAYTEMRPYVVGGEPDEECTDPHTVWLRVDGQQFCLTNYFNNKDEANWMRSMLAKAIGVITDRALAAQAEQLAANPQVGTCVICGAAIWRREAYMTDERGAFHPICAVIKDREQLRGHVEILLSEIRNAGLNETGHQRSAAYTLNHTSKEAE